MGKLALISLISDQPIPNVMAVLQREQTEQCFTHLEFIVSADKNDPSRYDRRFDEICQRIESFFAKRGYSISRQPPVDPYNIQATLKAFQKAIEALKQQDYEVVFNITGGTKLMSLAAYFCTRYNGLEAIYVESRDRFLISLSPVSDLNDALAIEQIDTERKSLREDAFRVIDVPSYIALYGREINSSITVNDLPQDQIHKAQIIVQYYATLRSRLSYLQNEITQAFKRNLISWPFQLELKRRPTQLEREALECFHINGILSWDSAQAILSCGKEQAGFLKGKWIEVYVLNELSSRNVFHDVRGDVTIKGWDGQCDVILTVNAQLAIIECKSEAKLSEQFGKIRALQRDRGGLYGRSFFIRSGETKTVILRAAEFYGIDQVIDAEELPRLAEIVAQPMGISASK